MQNDQIQTSYGFGSNFTKLGKQLLIIYGIIYVLELLFEHWFNIPIVIFLQLSPLQSNDFHFWQILTHPFIHEPSSPIAFLINCIVLYFFSGPVEKALGAKRFLTLFYCAAIGSAFFGLLFSMVASFHAPFMGMLPSLLALVVVFGFLNQPLWLSF